MTEEIPKQKTKIWKTAATFNTYEEADIERKKLAETNKMVKVRLSGDGLTFRVKVWNPLQENKKGKKRNANKKVRNRL